MVWVMSVHFSSYYITPGVPYPTRRTVLSKIVSWKLVTCCSRTVTSRVGITPCSHNAQGHFNPFTVPMAVDASLQQSTSILTKYYSNVESLRAYLLSILPTPSGIFDGQADTESFMNLLDISYVGVECKRDTTYRVYSTMLDMREVRLVSACYSWLSVS